MDGMSGRWMDGDSNPARSPAELAASPTAPPATGRSARSARRGARPPRESGPAEKKRFVGTELSKCSRVGNCRIRFQADMTTCSARTSKSVLPQKGALNLNILQFVPGALQPV